MIRSFLSMTLLRTAGLFGHSAQAAPTYVSSTNATSPQGSYTAFCPDVAT